MTAENPTCFGCCINPGWGLPPNNQEPFRLIKPKVLSSLDGLTNDEQLVLNCLRNAWDRFIILEDRREDFTREFQDAIHRCQSIIALRVAKRVNPEVWV